MSGGGGILCVVPCIDVIDGIWALLTKLIKRLNECPTGRMVGKMKWVLRTIL